MHWTDSRPVQSCVQWCTDLALCPVVVYPVVVQRAAAGPLRHVTVAGPPPAHSPPTPSWSRTTSIRSVTTHSSAQRQATAGREWHTNNQHTNTVTRHATPEWYVSCRVAEDRALRGRREGEMAVTWKQGRGERDPVGSPLRRRAGRFGLRPGSLKRTSSIFLPHQYSALSIFLRLRYFCLPIYCFRYFAIRYLSWKHFVQRAISAWNDVPRNIGNEWPPTAYFTYLAMFFSLTFCFYCFVLYQWSSLLCVIDVDAKKHILFAKMSNFTFFTLTVLEQNFAHFSIKWCQIVKWQ